MPEEIWSNDYVGPILNWRDIKTVPDGRRVFLWLEKGEKGNGELAVGMCFRKPDGSVDGWWTWGGPNSGSDDNECPTHWAPLSPNPAGEYLT